MNQLINKTEVIKDLQKDIRESDNWLVIAIYMAFAIRIMNYPTLELVRCKDCIHHKPFMPCEDWRQEYICDVFEWKSEDDDFCSFAERRTE